MTNHFRPLSLGAHVMGGDAALGPEERRRHLHLVGQTGTGKSTLLLNLIAQDLAADHGLALLDPHGDLALAALAHVPRRRRNELVYIDPADADWPIGFNPLARVPEPLKPVAADGIVAAFRALVERHVRDPLVRSFWLNEYAGYSQNFRVEAIAPIQNKIGKALMAPSLRNMLAQPRSTITLRRLMDERAIVICNLSKGQLGESTAHLIGALLVTAIAQAALSRADSPVAERRVFHLYADEFQSFASESFSLILSEARKYALTLTIAHQYLEQLPDRLRAAVFGNVGSIVVCRPGATDAPALAAQIGIANPDAVLDLPNFAAWARLLLDGVPSSPLRLDLYAPPLPHRGGVRRLIALSRYRFGRPRAQVERRIAEFLAQY